MANKISRTIAEEGIIVSKEYVEAKGAWTNRDGVLIEARPEKYVLKCVSGEDCRQDVGFSKPVFNEYEVAKEEFEKAKYLQKVLCKYDFSEYGIKPVGVKLL